MNFIFIVLFIVFFFIVLFFYAKLHDEIKNVKGKGFVDEVKKEIEGLIVEFNKVSNRKILVIEEKIKELNNLIKMADERILKLDALTRNYTEIIKRYELIKKEVQLPFVERKTNYIGDSSANEVENVGKEIKRQVYKTHKSYTDQESEKKSKKGQSFKSHDDQREESEVENINLEELDFGARADLLKKLLSMEIDENKLLKMGFSQSEIEIAKIVLSSKR